VCQLVTSLSSEEVPFSCPADLVHEALYCELLQQDRVADVAAAALVDFVSSEKSFLIDNSFSHSFWRCISSHQAFQDAVIRHLMRAALKFSILDFGRANSVFESLSQVSHRLSR
jgi:hypothetical protein